MFLKKPCLLALANGYLKNEVGIIMPQPVCCKNGIFEMFPAIPGKAFAKHSPTKFLLPMVHLR